MIVTLPLALILDYWVDTALRHGAKREELSVVLTKWSTILQLILASLFLLFQT